MVAPACAVGDEIGETVGSVTQQVDDGLQAVPVANAVTCQAERQTVELAVEAYYALVGSYPTTVEDLVTQELLRTAPQLYDVDATGAVVPAVGSNCS